MINRMWYEKIPLGYSAQPYYILLYVFIYKSDLQQFSWLLHYKLNCLTSKKCKPLISLQSRAGVDMWCLMLNLEINYYKMYEQIFLSTVYRWTEGWCVGAEKEFTAVFCAACQSPQKPRRNQESKGKHLPRLDSCLRLVADTFFS